VKLTPLFNSEDECYTSDGADLAKEISQALNGIIKRHNGKYKLREMETVAMETVNDVFIDWLLGDKS
jgi:hypothetical protein